MTTPDKPVSGIKLKTWQILLIVLFGLIAIGQFSEDESSTNSTSDNNSAVEAVTDPSRDLSWIPKDFNIFSGDSNLAWRWGTNSETKCTYSTGACWSAFVIAREGCPTGLYGEIAILDRSGVQIDYTNDTTTRVLPMSKVKLTFDTFNEDAETAQIAEFNCR